MLIHEEPAGVHKHSVRTSLALFKGTAQTETYVDTVSTAPSKEMSKSTSYILVDAPVELETQREQGTSSLGSLEEPSRVVKNHLGGPRRGRHSQSLKSEAATLVVA